MTPGATPQTRVADTLVESLYAVNPEHANPLSILHGGRLMDWLVSTGTLASVRLSRGNVVLGWLDDLFFINPVRVGEWVTARAWVEFVGRSTLEVGVEAYSENIETGTRSLTTLSHMAFVAIDGQGNPRPVPVGVQPGPGEEETYQQAAERRQRRLRALADRRERVLDTSDLAPQARWKRKISRVVFTPDTMDGTYLFGGRLLHFLDEFTATLAMRFCRGVVVTGAVDSMAFYHPIRLGDVVDFEAALTYAGRSSMEVGVKVVTENPAAGIRRHASTAYFTFIHLDESGKPTSLPPYEPTSEDEKRRWQEAEERKKRRLEMSRQLRALAERRSGRFF